MGGAERPPVVSSTTAARTTTRTAPPEEAADDLRAHAPLVAFGALFVFASSVGQTFFLGFFAPELRAAFDLSDRALGETYAAATVASGATLLFAGRLVDRVPLLPWAMGIVFGLAGAAALLASASTPLGLALALYGLRLFGQGLSTHTAITVVARQVRRRRGLALALTGLGFPAGEALLPRLRLPLVDALGWRGAWWAIAGVLVLAVVPASLALLGLARRPPARPAADPTASTSAAPAAPRAAVGDAPDRTLGEALRDPRFPAMLFGVLAPPFIITGVFFHQARLAEAHGWSPTLLAESFVAYALATPLSSLGSGPLADRLGARRLLPAVLLPLGLGSVIAGLVDAPWAAPAYLSLFGLTAGASGTVVNAAWPELYGVRHLGSIRAAVMAAMVASTAASPPLFGALIVEGVPMDTTVLGCAVHAVLASAALAWVAFRRH
ncbi:MAG TPA: MFS transporter [Polyangiaceae bacterium LLY-WYZ-14_1]|nr:MFS transporter [Polyangiaceae bacterium LLY-WYZ-14_1]